MELRARRQLQMQETSHAPAWLITFCDLVFLLLAFFVLKFSMSSPKQPISPQQIQAAGDIQNIASLKGGEATSILGAFSPGDTDNFSFRGTTSLAALAKQASDLGQDIVVSIELVTLPKEINGQSQSVKELLISQRKAVLRQLVDSGLSLDALLVEPINLPKPDWFSVTNEDKSLSSRITLILQDKRS